MQIITPHKLDQLSLRSNDLQDLFISENDNFINLYKLAWKLNVEKNISPLLASIDPYDCTVFNHNQCEDILLEIEKIIKIESLEGLHNLVSIIKNIKIGEYLILIGD